MLCFYTFSKAATKAVRELYGVLAFFIVHFFIAHNFFLTQPSCFCCVLVFPGDQLNISSTHFSGDVFPVGETPVYYTATDPSGNNRTCELIITVQGK